MRSFRFCNLHRKGGPGGRVGNRGQIGQPHTHTHHNDCSPLPPPDGLIRRERGETKSCVIRRENPSVKVAGIQPHVTVGQALTQRLRGTQGPCRQAGWSRDLLSSTGDARTRNHLPAACGRVTVTSEGWAVGATFAFQRDPLWMVAIKVQRRDVIGGPS